jgi:hypothetical protein
MSTLTRNPANYTRGTGRVRFQKKSTTGFFDMGNIPDLKVKSPQTKFVDHMASINGVLQLDRHEVSEVMAALNYSIDEFNADNLALILRSTPTAAFSQGSATGATLSVPTPTIGLWFSLGKYRVTSVVATVTEVLTGSTTNASAVVTGISSTAGLRAGDAVTGTGIPVSTTILSVNSSTQVTLSANATATGTPSLTFVSTKVEGTDYDVDYTGGFIQFLPTGNVQTTDTVALTFNVPAIAGDSLAPLTDSGILQGTAIVDFTTSDGRYWRFAPWNSTITYTGDIDIGNPSAFAKASADITFMPDFTKSQPYGSVTILPGT